MHVQLLFLLRLPPSPLPPGVSSNAPSRGRWRPHSPSFQQQWMCELPLVSLWCPSPGRWHKIRDCTKTQSLITSVVVSSGCLPLPQPIRKPCSHQIIQSQELGLGLLHYALIIVGCVTYSFRLFIHLYQPQLLREMSWDWTWEPPTQSWKLELFCHLAVQPKQHSSDNKAGLGPGISICSTLASV